jgi:hypothetical protein
MTQGIFPDNSSNFIFNFRDQFLRKLQACSTPLDLNDDDAKQVRRRVIGKLICKNLMTISADAKLYDYCHYSSSRPSYQYDRKEHFQTITHPEKGWTSWRRYRNGIRIKFSRSRLATSSTSLLIFPSIDC